MILLFIALFRQTWLDQSYRYTATSITLKRISVFKTITSIYCSGIFMALTAQQLEMATLIIDILNIDDVDPAEVEHDAIMFDETGLGLDSIDALEIAVAVAMQYDVYISAEDEATRDIFATLGSLTAHVMQESQGRQTAS
jgi:acyl carrier protein